MGEEAEVQVFALGADATPLTLASAALFGISKKVFKQTLGALYKSRRIVIGEDGIRLAEGASR